MVSVITLFVIGYWYRGLRDLLHGVPSIWRKCRGLQVIVLDRMLYLFFAFLFLMLMFSNMIIGYSTLFKSQETQWMLTFPSAVSTCFAGNSWRPPCWRVGRSCFCRRPLMAAYGNARHVSPSLSI